MKPGGAPRAARVDPYADIAMRHPFLGIHDLPVLVFVGRSVGDVGVVWRSFSAMRSDSLPEKKGPWHRDHRSIARGRALRLVGRIHPPSG